MYYALLWRECNLLKELKKIFVALAFLLTVCVGNLSAQYAKLVDSKKYTKAEMALFNASVGYFESGDYSNASRGFAQLHSWYPSDPVFCYYCGATMVMLRTEYDKAIKYLLLAYDNELIESDYYIGLAYHNKYLFTKAIIHYDRYLNCHNATPKDKSSMVAEVASLRAKAVRAREIGKYSYVLNVMTNSKVKRSNFHLSYGRKLLDGNIVVKPDFFKMKNDKYIKDVDLVYVLDTIAFLSSYGKDKKESLDIYYSHKIRDLKSKDSTAYIWSAPQFLPGNVNTDQDEAFPFLASDGSLYFASKGHNSIGGYDIFKSEYNSDLHIWLEPENLGFPINTPYNDFMYAIESNGGSAFFASDRVSKDGQLMVCRYVVNDGGDLIRIDSEEEFSQKAELPVSPGAEAEYEKNLKEKQEEQNAEKEEEEAPVVQQEADTTNLYVSTRTLLDEKLDAISKYQEYSQKLNAYSRMTSEKIKTLRAQGGAGASASEVSKMANSVVVFYDLSQKFKTVHSIAKPTLDYCGKEMEFLDKLEKGSGQYLFKLQNINLSVEKVNANSPLDVMIAEKKDEREQVQSALNQSNATMLKGKKAIKEIMAKLEACESGIQNAADGVSRERYVNEKNMLEKSMADINNNSRKTLAEVKRLNMMIEKLDETISMLESIDEYLSNVDIDGDDEVADLGASDILSLKNYISDEEKRVQQEYHDMIEEDENLYSELFAYESGSGTRSGNKIVTDQVVSMKKYVSAPTSNLIESMAKTDSLYSEKEKLEHTFDASKNDEEKKTIINQINSTQAKIDRIEKEIAPELEYENNTSVSKAIVEYNSIKQTQVGTEEWGEKVSATQMLIDKSKELETMISDGVVESDEPKVKLLSKMKSDIDGQIVANVDEMRDIVSSQQIAKKEIAELNNEISRIRSVGKDKSAEADVRKDVNSAAKKIDEAKRVDTASGNNLNDAENIIDAAVEKRIAILNQEYETESKVYDVLSGKYETAGRNEVRRQHADAVYYSALEDRQKAETVSDEVEKMSLLSEANAKLKSANAELMQIVAPGVKAETAEKDALTESIVSLHEELESQKNSLAVNSNHGQKVNPSEKGSKNVAVSSRDGIDVKSLKSSVSLQNNYENKIVTADTEISKIESNIVAADSKEKKRLLTELGEVTAVRNENIRSFSAEKEHFYDEIDKSVREQVSNTELLAEYTDRYEDYLMSLDNLASNDRSIENNASVTEKLVETEKSEYALLQTIIPNVDEETKSVLSPIYSKLEEKYSTDQIPPQSVVEASVSTTNAGKTTVSSELKASVSRQEKYETKIVTADTEISDIESSLASADRSEKKRLQSELHEVTTERNDNVRSLGEEKQRFYAEIDKTAQEQISNTDASAEYSNRYADYRQTLYRLTTAEQNGENITEKLVETEKSEYALLQTIIPNVDEETKSVLSPIYSKLEEKYSTDQIRPQSGVEASVSEADENNFVTNTISEKGGKSTTAAQLKASVSRQEKYETKIVTADTEINDIESSLASADRSEKKRLQTELNEVTTERNDNVRSLGEEKQRFYAEIDKTAQDQITNTDASVEYSNRYADYRQSLYRLTTAEQNGENITEKLAETEKSEYALLQTIIPNVDEETKSVLSPIYSKLEEKYSTGQIRPQSGVEASVSEAGENNFVTNTISEKGGKSTTAAQLKASVSRQEKYETKIVTADTEINDIESSLATADRSEKKRLQSELNEVTSERNDNVRSLGEEKQRFYAEIDKVAQEQISNTDASAEYSNKYADYRQTLYSLTNAEQNGENITETLAETEKSEYALLQTIIPNVDEETKSVLSPIYSKLEEKYSTDQIRPQSGVEASVSEADENNFVTNTISEKGGKSTTAAQLKASVSRQEKYETKIVTADTEINDIESSLASADRNEKKRLQSELNEVTTERNDNVRSLGEEKQRFYAEIDKTAQEQITNTDASAEYSNRYADYRQTLYRLTTAEQNGENITEKLAETEKSEYALLQTIIPNVDEETKSVLSPIYNKLEEKYSSHTEPEVAVHNQIIEVSESYSQSMNLQEQMIRNIDISTREIERLEQRKDGARKSEQRRIADDIAREESQKVDDIQKLAIEKTKFYTEINQSLETVLPKMSDSIRREYAKAYGSYNETLTTMKIGLGFYEMDKANKIYENAEVQEYKLLQQMKQVATGDAKNVVDDMIVRMESKNSSLTKYRVVIKYEVTDVAENKNQTTKNVVENNGTASNTTGNNISVNVPDSAKVTIEKVDTSLVLSSRKSMSGYNTDSYGIYNMPEINMGLYYRIQIVAVSVRYRMRDFNGLSLIFTELIPNTNIIRYMTGEYYKYVSAREDLPKVRSLGFSDAFIVAYYNGKRISIAEARRLEALQNVEENEEIPVVIRHEAPADYVEPDFIADNSMSTKNADVEGSGVVVPTNGTAISSNASTTSVSSSSNTATAISGSAVVAGMSAEDVTVKGVYYAVQIGVYKDKRQSWQMHGVSPIDYETMPNGFIRHTSGRFAEYDLARVAQMNIRRHGIPDAFVIACIDGRKVSFAEANEYKKSIANRNITERKADELVSQSQESNSQEENLSNVEYAPLNLSKGTEENNKVGISYYVQIGAFSKSPDPEILSVFSKVAGDKIHVKFPREGLQIYRIGVFNSYEEAQNTLAEARSFGIVDAFIVAFKGDEQISSSEAIRLQNAVRQIEGNTDEPTNNGSVQKSASQNVSTTSNTATKPVVPAETLQQSAGGVEYFVQLGAFVNAPDARSLATFRSVAANNGAKLTTVQNGRFTNYRVGAFKKFADVKVAVDAARSMGVTDAFVVAFYNGERIPVAEAKEKE